MEKHCVSCKKYTGNKNLKVTKTKQNRLMLLSNCGCLWQEKISFYKI